jgi:hypothetical protein
LNQTIRELDQRISSYSAPEEPLEGPASAKDAALVTIRRALRNTLNETIPETKPINKQLGDAIEVRSVLRKRFGQVANDSAEAASQYQSELKKGQDELNRQDSINKAQEQYDLRKQAVSRNKNIAKTVGKVALYGGGPIVGAAEVVKHLPK